MAASPNDDATGEVPDEHQGGARSGESAQAVPAAPEPAFDSVTDAIDPGAMRQLVATAIAVNPERRAWRQDLLLSAAVDLIVTGDRTSSQVLAELGQVWHTESLTRPLLDRALQDAQAAGLIVTLDDLSGVPRWQATAAARDETKQDRDWVASLLVAFEQEVAERLGDLAPDLSEKSKARASHHIICALAAGASATYEVTINHASGLRPVKFDDAAVQRYISSVDPRSARTALSELAAAAMDPDDEFGTDIVHLLVVGSLLHGMLTRRDVQVAPSFDGTRILLDTSALIGLIQEGTPEELLIKDLIEISSLMGVQVLIADHTVDEWGRVWKAAEAELPDDIDSRVVPLHSDRLPENPFIAEFMRRKAKDPKLGWARFRVDVADLKDLVSGLAVNVRPAGNDGADDISLQDLAYETLRKLSDDPEVRGQRSRMAASADAASLAMVARWRRKSGSERGAAYFIANDQLTSSAYELVVPEDSERLAVNAAGWLMYMASVTTDDPAERVNLVELVSHAVVRDRVLGMATSYTLEEAFLLSGMLEEGGELATGDVRAALQLDLLKLAAEGDSDSDRATLAGGEVLRRRSQRRDDRAHRRERLAADREAEAARKIAEAAAQIAASQTAEKDSLLQVVDLQTRNSEAGAAAESADLRVRRMKRILFVALFGVVLAAVAIALVATGTVTGKYRWVALACGVFYVAESVRFCVDTKVSWAEMLAAAGVAGALTAIQLLLA